MSSTFSIKRSSKNFAYVINKLYKSFKGFLFENVLLFENIEFKHFLVGGGIAASLKKLLIFFLKYC